MTDDALIWLPCPHDLAERETACADGRCPLCDAERLAALAQRIAGYQGSRDYAIDLLAKALGVEPDKMRAVEYYAREAAERIAALESSSLYQQLLSAERRATKAEAEAKALRELYKRHLRVNAPMGSGSSDAALDAFIDAALAGAKAVE